MRRLFHFEKRHQPVATTAEFTIRLARNFLWSLAVVVVSLVIGSTGYMYYESMKLVDAIANASMILSGMGPLSPLNTTGGKIFASAYAIASGLVLFALAGVIIAPIYHRIMHRFHLPESDMDEPAPTPPRKKKRQS